MNRDAASLIPDALSHRQLNQWLESAVQERFTSFPEDKDALAADLADWAGQTRTLLRRLAEEGDSIGAERSAQQVMALGSFRTHLMLGLQALKASQPGH